MYHLNTKIRLTMLCLSGFELYSRWVPLKRLCVVVDSRISAAKVCDCVRRISARCSDRQNSVGYVV